MREVPGSIPGYRQMFCHRFFLQTFLTVLNVGTSASLDVEGRRFFALKVGRKSEQKNLDY